jgi:DNA invertase Pin-like site-specific DNA recombinase
MLVVAKLDRLSRSLLDFASVMAISRKEGWQVVVLDLAVDTSTPSGELMANVLASFAAYERRLIGQRTSAALQQKKAGGARLGRPRTMNPQVTSRIVAERAAGRSLPAIARSLNEDGVPTARGGRSWLPGTVSAVLRSAALDQEAFSRSA